MSSKRPWTPSLEEALKLLGGCAESVGLAVKDIGPQVIDAFRKNSLKSVGAPSSESGAHLCMDQINKYVRDLVGMVDECYAHLGYKSQFTDWCEKHFKS